MIPVFNVIKRQWRPVYTKRTLRFHKCTHQPSASCTLIVVQIMSVVLVFVSQICKKPILTAMKTDYWNGINSFDATVLRLWLHCILKLTSRIWLLDLNQFHDLTYKVRWIVSQLYTNFSITRALLVYPIWSYWFMT